MNCELRITNYELWIMNCELWTMNYQDTSIACFVKEMRKKFNLTQVDLADKSGVGLRFIRDLEQGKQTLRLDKVNQVLSLFGRQVGAVEKVKKWKGEKVKIQLVMTTVKPNNRKTPITVKPNNRTT